MSRLTPRLMVVLLGVLACACPASAQYVFVEGVNHTLPPEPGWSVTAGHEQAFRWTAQNSFDLIQILWHSTKISNGIIRLREDTGTTPGPVWRQVGFNSGVTGWNGAPFATAYPVVAGQTYFVSLQSGIEYHEFLGQGGILLTYYWAIGGTTNWNGPYTWGGHRMIKFYKPGPAPCPGDFDCDGDRDFDDIDPFVEALNTQQCKCPEPKNCDPNGDGKINFDDIDPFVALIGVPCP